MNGFGFGFNKTAQGEIAKSLLFSFALSPESYEHRCRQVFWLVPAFPRLPDSEKVSDIMEKAQIGTYSYGYSR